MITLIHHRAAAPVLLALLLLSACAPANSESWSTPYSKGYGGIEKVGVMGPSGSIGP